MHQEGIHFSDALLVACFLGAVLLAAAQPIDWSKARLLHQKVLRGETLTPAEQAYYDRARAAFQQRQRFLSRQAAPPPWTNHLAPLTDLGTNYYQGQEGGLYGGGRNQPSPGHADAALRQTARIQPLDADGKPSASGKIVLLSVGMSNTAMEFSRFKAEAEANPAKSPSVVIVNGAQGGQTATAWAHPEARLWQVVAQRLERTGVTTAQVQVAWILQAEAMPRRLGAFPAHARVLQAHLVRVLNLLKRHFRNLRIAYLSSRIYAGYATTPLNPEPYAYESAFAVRWLIKDQIAGAPDLNFDPAKGAVRAPLLLWGPYLWADGTRPRQSDSLVWKRSDLSPRDGTHPSESGCEKVARLLMRFFETDATARRWFLKPRNE